jgi:hypothetical protein
MKGMTSLQPVIGRLFDLEDCKSKKPEECRIFTMHIFETASKYAEGLRPDERLSCKEQGDTMGTSTSPGKLPPGHNPLPEQDSLVIGVNTGTAAADSIPGVRGFNRKHGPGVSGTSSDGEGVFGIGGPMAFMVGQRRTCTAVCTVEPR